jgi:hypothetical protein
MLKYLENISRKLNDIKSGMEKYSEKWEQIPENHNFVQSVIDEINFKNRQIELLRDELSRQYLEAREMKNEKMKIVARLEKRAIGVHADSPEKLNEYGIKNNFNK